MPGAVISSARKHWCRAADAGCCRGVPGHPGKHGANIGMHRSRPPWPRVSVPWRGEAVTAAGKGTGAWAAQHAGCGRNPPKGPIRFVTPAGSARASVHDRGLDFPCRPDDGGGVKSGAGKVLGMLRPTVLRLRDAGRPPASDRMKPGPAPPRTVQVTCGAQPVLNSYCILCYIRTV